MIQLQIDRVVVHVDGVSAERVRDVLGAALIALQPMLQRAPAGPIDLSLPPLSDEDWLAPDAADRLARQLGAHLQRGRP